jgi:hypothetical protein
MTEQTSFQKGNIFQAEEILEFFMAPTVKTHLIVLAQKIIAI